MKLLRKLGAWAVLVVLAALAGCAGSHLPSVPLPPVPAHVEGYSALCFARWRGPQKSGHARLAIAYLEPGRIRLEALDPAGGTRAVLIASREGALWIDPARRQFHTYPDGSSASRELVGISLVPQTLGALLWGPGFLGASSSCAEAAPTADGKARRCSLREGGELEIPAASGAPARLIRPGGSVLEISWDPEDPRHSAPRWLEIRQADPSWNLRLETRQIRLVSPPADLFAIDPPPGFSAAPEAAP